VVNGIDYPRLEAWTTGLSASLTERNARAGMARLAEALLALVPNVHVYFGFFRRDAVPIIIKGDYDDSETAFDRLYVMGKYLLDPLYEEFLKRNASVCLSPQQMFSPKFREQEFYRDLYRPYGWRDKISYLLYLSPELAAFVTLARRVDEPRYTRDEHRILLAVLPGVKRAMARFWGMLDAADRGTAVESLRLHRVLTDALVSFGDGTLSERESEVTRLLLKGLAPKYVSRQLGIAPGTVRNHIKHIYGKLNVRSQAALVALFIAALEKAAKAGINDG
jgi:DNA-binding CsgD family transcriptional regulator